MRDILPSKTIASSEWIVFRPIMGLPAFYRTYFSSSTFRTKLLSQVSGVGGSLTRARPKLVKEYPVPLAPVAEQKEIVAMLESYLEKESASKKLVFSASKQLDLMRQQLVSAALAGRLTTVLR